MEDRRNGIPSQKGICLSGSHSRVSRLLPDPFALFLAVLVPALGQNFFSFVSLDMSSYLPDSPLLNRLALRSTP